MAAPKVFFVTGTSSGFGNELIKVILSAGHNAVATSRNASKLSFSGATESNYLGVDLDVTSQESVDKGFKAAVDKFGKVDVVCNNAGYGLCGVFESLSEEQMRAQMDVNFFGLMKVTKKAMEVMRDQKTGGVIQQVTSIAGQTGSALFSLYSASKWAVEGFTEAVSKEVDPSWGIKFTCIEPGGFRTDWAGTSLDFGSLPIPAYGHHVTPQEFSKKRDKTQPGDPVKGAKAMFELGLMADPPLRVVIGSDAYKLMGTKLETYAADRTKYEKISNSTDVEE